MSLASLSICSIASMASRLNWQHLIHYNSSSNITIVIIIMTNLLTMFTKVRLCFLYKRVTFWHRPGLLLLFLHLLFTVYPLYLVKWEEEGILLFFILLPLLLLTVSPLYHHCTLFYKRRRTSSSSSSTSSSSSSLYPHCTLTVPRLMRGGGGHTPLLSPPPPPPNCIPTLPSLCLD